MESLDEIVHEISHLRAQPVVGKGKPFKRLVLRSTNFFLSRLMNILSLLESTAREQQRQITELAAQVEQLQRHQAEDADAETVHELSQSTDRMQFPDWEQNLSAEVAFWQSIIADRGVTFGCSEEVEERLNPDTPLQDYLRELLPASGHVRILDIGAGPFTTVGKKWEGRTVEIVAVDALAQAYDSILAEYGIVPPVRTIECVGEKVADMFPAQSFDLVHIKNALDHCFDPIAVLKSALAVCKPQGFIFLSHHANEGRHQGYCGLHQWNLAALDNHFMLWNPDSVHWVNDLLKGTQIRCNSFPMSQGEYWLNVVIQRLSEKVQG
jgi:SAM-dependent methyltransferase